MQFKYLNNIVDLLGQKINWGCLTTIRDVMVTGTASDAIQVSVMLVQQCNKTSSLFTYDCGSEFYQFVSYCFIESFNKWLNVLQP